MLAVLASHAFTIITPAALKESSLIPPSCQSLESSATAAAWSSDTSVLFVAVNGELRRYTHKGQFEKTVHLCDGSISAMVVKDKANTVIFALENKVHMLECSTGKISSIFDYQAVPITSLSLSNDATMLAVTSDTTCTVHNISLASQIAVRGWPSGLGNITTCSFHPHTKSRLLLGMGKHLLIYDTSRPSTPLKTVSLGSGEVVAIACSPFSKTLIAVACSGGSVGLVDLEKEKGLFKTLDVKAPITSSVFSQDGSAVILGTQHGKILVLDLRVLDKPPRSMTISEDGERIVALAVQKRLKSTVLPIAPSASNVASKTRDPVAKPLAPQDVNSPLSARGVTERNTKRTVPVIASSPASTKATSSVRGVKSPVRRTSSGTTVTEAPARKKVAVVEGSKGKPFSPTRPRSRASEGGSDISAQLETLASAVVKPKSAIKSTMASSGSSVPKTHPILQAKAGAVSATSRSTNSSVAAGSQVAAISRGRNDARNAVQGTKRTAIARVASDSNSAAISSEKRSRVSTSSTATIPTLSSASSSASISTGEKDRLKVRTNGDKETRLRTRTRTLSSVSGQSRPASRPISRGTDRLTPSNDAGSRTPSPDLPSPSMDPLTPVPQSRYKDASGRERRVKIPGLATPEMEMWVKARDGLCDQKTLEQARREGKNDGSFELGRESEIQEDMAKAADRELEMPMSASTAMQISPCRPIPTTFASSHFSPLRAFGLVNSPSRPRANTSSGAQDLLRAMIKDVMNEYRQEAREEVVGLHLDLVRMGRGWKNELRSLMEEYVGDLGELREENRRLREENERLRRGY